ncbi:hypothetical protein IW261DRAFT_1425680 [Armillaria novae-zelandiae]|uniref:Uncharacterized protein n=1 Tax=Armillaria novae-zelandiae TaxID=153914 RepID=A0AA39NST3_9AGAR|nr:hypothetical protein IW261DRAFT_1425680 [Armillaria novae-zelandiae]
MYSVQLYDLLELVHPSLGIWRTVTSAPSRLPLGTLLIPPPDPSGDLSDDSQFELQTPSPTPTRSEVPMDETPPPAAPPHGDPTPQVLAFPATKDDFCLISPVTANDSPHRNGPEFTLHGPKQEKQVTCLQPNLGNFEGSVFHWILFNGGQKLVDISKPKPWEVLNKTLIPLLEENETLKVYQGLLEKIPDDRLAPPFLVVIEASGDIRDVLLRQRILALNENLALHIVPADCQSLSWTVWLFKANEPIITGSTEEIAAIGETLHFIILKDLWEDSAFWMLLYPMTRNRTDDPKKAILDAITASYVEFQGARDTQYWVLFMRQPSPKVSAEEWNMLHAHVQKKTIRSGNISITPALPRTGNQFCTICKLDTHPTFDCSFTWDNTVFQGPTKPLIGGQHEG